MIFAGTLTERLDFYRIEETQTASGFKSTDEVLFWSCKANRRKNKESYAVNAEELFHITELTFTFRYNKDIDETDIVVYNGKRYRITSIDASPREREMTIRISKINE